MPRKRPCLLPVLVAAILAVCGPPIGEVSSFLEDAEARLLEVWVNAEKADWEMSNDIRPETEARAAETSEAEIAVAVELAKEASQFGTGGLDPVEVRKLELIKTSITLPAPSDRQKRSELAQIKARMESAYGTGEYCPEGGECLELEDLESVIDNSRDPEALLEAWKGWRTVSPAIRADFQRYAELANEGARELGYDDLGAMWRAKYDMKPDDLRREVDRLWDQVRPLYQELHCHVRARLVERYGADVVDPKGPIPAQLLGNMWAQSWSNIYDLVAPPASDPGYDLTEALNERGVDAVEMVRYGERFFTSLGLDPLPETFWERSLFTKPDDRAVVCHASAWAVDYYDDLRIKMCIEVNAEDFATIHHELGHNYYQAAYKDQDPLFRDSANDGFHEALGDTVALSVTPKYLVDLGLIEEEPPPEADLGLLMRMALDKVAFLPFGLLVDQWRWQVFSGEIVSERYNQGWWELREKYQGVGPPIERSETDFDPGAKYHVPANVSYTRYFLAHILQFQLHRELCEIAGFEGPLNRCSIYGNAEAGAKLEEMMSMGLSRPWPEALATIGGSGEMDATAILDYFAPLSSWLQEQNAGRTCGW